MESELRIITPGGSLHGEELRTEKSYAGRSVAHGEEYTPRGVHIVMRWRLGPGLVEGIQ